MVCRAGLDAAIFGLHFRSKYDMGSVSCSVTTSHYTGYDSRSGLGCFCPQTDAIFEATVKKAQFRKLVNS